MYYRKGSESKEIVFVQVYLEEAACLSADEVRLQPLLTACSTKISQNIGLKPPGKLFYNLLYSVVFLFVIKHMKSKLNNFVFFNKNKITFKKSKYTDLLYKLIEKNKCVFIFF